MAARSTMRALVSYAAGVSSQFLWSISGGQLALESVVVHTCWNLNIFGLHLLPPTRKTIHGNAQSKHFLERLWTTYVHSNVQPRESNPCTKMPPSRVARATQMQQAAHWKVLPDGIYHTQASFVIHDGIDSIANVNMNHMESLMKMSESFH